MGKEFPHRPPILKTPLSANNIAESGQFDNGGLWGNSLPVVGFE